MGQLLYCWSIGAIFLANYGEVQSEWLRVLNFIAFAFFVVVGAFAGWMWARTQ